jgi:hypothetical protein
MLDFPTVIGIVNDKELAAGLLRLVSHRFSTSATVNRPRFVKKATTQKQQKPTLP